MAKGSHTPNNPTKAPNVPTGPEKAAPKSSPSKVMKPMSKKSGKK